MKALRSLLAAFSYFSILPVRSYDTAPAAASIAWLPLVGAIVGALAGSAAWGAWLYTHSPVWPPAVAFALLVVLSGGIHIDGFLDCCDALFASLPPRRRLDVLHDPHHGSFAVAGMAVLTVFWIAALAHVRPDHLPAVLALVGATSRTNAVALAGQYPHARTRTEQYPLLRFAALWLLAEIVCAPIAGVSWAALLACVASAQLAGWWASRRLDGGLTGDVYGWAIVISEVAAIAAVGLT